MVETRGSYNIQFFLWEEMFPLSVHLRQRTPSHNCGDPEAQTFLQTKRQSHFKTLQFLQLQQK